jgi:dTDP-4-dehydrorhamnose 3,5-epimerase-like enzyme
MKSKVINIKSFEDDRGSLLPLEFSNIGFEPKRLFVVNNVPINSIRGNHAHYKTRQFIICINGVVNVILDYIDSKEIIKLVKHEAIMVPEMVWDSQEFLSNNSEILVVCSTVYDIDDYILDYDKFKDIIKEK